MSQSPPLKITPDITVLWYMLAVVTLTCVCFGLAPALHGTKPQSMRSHLRLRSALMTAQVAMSVLLLVGAGLMLEGVKRASSRDPGFTVEDVSVISFELPPHVYNFERTRGFFAELLQSVQNMPGVGPVGLSVREPFSGAHPRRTVSLPGQLQQQARLVEYQEVSSGYFEVLRIPFLAGRNVESGDERSHGILVNRAMASQFWGDVNAIGKAVIVNGERCEVIGVVRDAYTDGLDGIEPLVYQPFGGRFLPKLLVRSNTSAVGAIAAAAAHLDSRIRTQATPLEESRDRWLGPSLVGAEIAGLLGLFALALASAGMFGVFAYAVQQRTKEIGIRMALGAKRSQVIQLVLGGTSRAVLVGMGLGLVGAVPASRLIQDQLFGVSPLSPLTYVSIVVILAVAALAASYLPARRAVRIDPIIALRHE